MARMDAQKRATALLAATEAVDTLVKALAAGKLKHLPPPSMDGVRKSDRRYAPYFAAGKGAGEKGTVPYNTRWIEKQIIMDGKPSKWLRVALQLLVGRERGYCDAYVFESIARCRPGYGLTDLEQGLKKKEREWEVLHGTDIAFEDSKPKLR